MNLTTHLHLMASLQMSGVIGMHTVCFMCAQAHPTISKFGILRLIFKFVFVK